MPAHKHLVNYILNIDLSRSCFVRIFGGPCNPCGETWNGYKGELSGDIGQP